MPRHDQQRRYMHGRQGPPDYTQRSVKWKLFLLVAGLILVLAIAEQVRQPKAWEWLWRLDQMTAEPEADFDNRLKRTPLLSPDDPEGTFIAAVEENPTAQSAGANDAHQPDAQARDADDRVGFDPAARAWEQGWRDVFDRLEPTERSLLFEMLHAAAHHQALDPDKSAAAADLLHKAGSLWQDYQAVARQSLAELDDADRTLWDEVLGRVNAQFNDDLRPALQAIIDGRTPTGAEEQSLASFQATLERLTLARIEDNTVLRPAEREILFHLLDRICKAQPDELAEKVPGPVAYLQLFDQPDDYRGQLVTVEGTVKLAYRVKAPDNYLGIDEFYVYWIHPRGGPSAPIVVYALAAPTGFPSIRHKELDRNTTEMWEDVTVTGVFFKRWAYAGKGGTYTAPLILANAPTWQPTSALADARQALGPKEFVAIVAAALLMALCATLVLWRRTRRERPSDAYGPADPNLAALRDVPLAPSPQETLKNLERNAGSHS